MTARPHPTPAAIAAAVRAETLLRPRGAQARVAKRLGCDRATVTRAMRRAAPVDDLAYTPAPGELELKAQQARDAALLQMELLRQLVLTPVVARDVARTLHALPAPCAPAQQSRPAATIARVARGPMRDDTNVAVFVAQVAIVEVLTSAGLVAIAGHGKLAVVLAVLSVVLWWRL
jgi:hypothetical protein